LPRRSEHDRLNARETLYVSRRAHRIRTGNQHRKAVVNIEQPVRASVRDEHAITDRRIE
jgi:hypothetical protein